MCDDLTSNYVLFYVFQSYQVVWGRSCREVVKTPLCRVFIPIFTGINSVKIA